MLTVLNTVSDTVSRRRYHTVLGLFPVRLLPPRCLCDVCSTPGHSTKLHQLQLAAAVEQLSSRAAATVTVAKASPLAAMPAA
jgi:hypothetical protein